MPPMTVAVAERRRFTRRAVPAQFGVSFLKPAVSVPADGVNLSGGGLCLRLRETLDVRAVVRLQLTTQPRASRGIECTGRVAWVSQRLDLRPTPPFLFDVGIEFVRPSPRLRRWLHGYLTQTGGRRARRPG